MKKIIAGVILALVAICAAYAQKDVTQFLGIPIDGPKSEMIRALHKKGFKYSAQDDKMEGTFNGSDVVLEIADNKNKVCRIVVYPATADKNITNVRIQFNNLCRQFLKKGNYLPCSTDSCMVPEYEDIAIPKNEDIRYEMRVNNKRYEAAFYQLPAHIDSLSKEIEPMEYVSFVKTDRAGNKIDVWPTLKLMDLYSKRLVWFKIEEYRGHYFIAIFYDNEYNRADGEDL
ncbi:MAG: hypothetical protein K2L27_06740 [Muribaculaceae bacterium]|nr:hypothetical protein [Muribaculaceae bacterium]